MPSPTITRRRRLADVGRCVAIAGVLFGLYAVLPLRGSRWWIGMLIGLAAVAAAVPITVRRTQAVLLSDRPIFEALSALVLLASLVLTGFSAIYYAMDRDQNQFIGLDTRLDGMYFTVTTLGTVGFGDITASGQAARVVVTIQILVDLSVLAFAVRAVTAAARRRVEEGE